MNPQHFPQADTQLSKPASMTDEECGSLWVCTKAEGQCISLWRTTWWERLKFLFHGNLWLGVSGEGTQPPVWLDMTKTVFIEEATETIEE